MIIFKPLFSVVLVLVSTEAFELGSRSITEDIFSSMLNGVPGGSDRYITILLPSFL